MTAVKLDDVSFSYDNVGVLNDISLELNDSNLTCIIGPNGVGKTTLVKCINRLLKPSKGTITLDGMDISTFSLFDLAKKMAFVPNSVSNVFSMSVSEAILMGRYPHSGWMTSEEDLRVVEEMIHIMHLEDLADRNFRELSAGQTQRVVIARGLAQEPEILILDEPTSNLDVKHQMDIMKFLNNYSKNMNIKVIMVCHDLNITSSFADRIIMMHNGRVFADGTADQVMTEENIREVYNVNSRIIDVDGRPHIIMLKD